MTISQQLITINEAKQDIKAAIIEKGQTVADNMNEYAEAIDNISGGTVDNTDYLCFEALEDSAVSLSNFGSNTPDIEYSFNKQNWTQWDYNNIDLPTGTKIYFRGDNPNGFSKDFTYLSRFVNTGLMNISGNIMTLIDKNGEVNEVPNNAFIGLFRFFNIEDARTLKLPATIVNESSYHAMFRESNIKYAPSILPALTLAKRCYHQMFFNCSTLVESPYLPAKELVSVTTNADACYGNMFSGCSKMQYIKAEFTTAPTRINNIDFLASVASTGCFIKANDATWTDKASYACPTGWTLITSVV